MPFSEKTKLDAKKRSAFRCCICHKLFVEIHHIIPQAKGGSDDIENAAPLCSSCHDLFGGNPEKRKQIREMRDYWWKLMSVRQEKLSQSPDLKDYCLIDEDPDRINQLHTKHSVIYHNIFKEEGFEKSAEILFDLLSHSIKDSPNKKRILFLDIEGHLNENGGFDHDMFELQYHFILNIILPFLSECYTPLISVKNNNPQRKDIPEGIKIFEDKGNNLSDMIKSDDDYEIYLADNNRWISSKKNNS